MCKINIKSIVLRKKSGGLEFTGIASNYYLLGYFKKIVFYLSVCVFMSSQMMEKSKKIW